MATVRKFGKVLYGIQSLGLDSLTLDPELQPRVKTNTDTIRDYSELYLEEPNLPQDQWLPPIVVYFDEATGKFHVADGFHRVEARRKANYTDIRAEVRPGGKDEALLFSVGANAGYGLPRTAEDKKNAVLRLLDHVKWCMLPPSEVARYCRVSETFVRSLKTRYEDDLPKAPLARIGTNGQIVKPSKVPESRLVGTSRPAVLPQGIQVTRTVLNDHYGPDVFKRISATDPSARANVPTKFGKIDIATDSILYWFAAINDSDEFWRQWGKCDFQRRDFLPDTRMVFIGVFSRHINQIIEFCRRHHIVEFFSPDHFLLEGV